MRQAVILAAGGGKRLGPEAQGLSKCLLSVGGRSLVDHQLEVLEEIGVQEICVVAGYCAEKVRDHLDGRCHVIVNERWAETNSLYSLWLARHWVGGEFFLLNSDVLASGEVFQRLVDFPGSCLAYDSSSGHDDEHMKVWVENGYLQAVSKCLPPERTSGENVGILRFEGRAARLLMRSADALIAADGIDNWAPAALNRLVPRLEVGCVDIRGLPWVEIDSAGDLEAAREEVWPVIRDSLASPAAG